MITTGWLERIIERNKAAYEEKMRAQARAREEAHAKVQRDTRKDVERKLRATPPMMRKCALRAAPKAGLK